MGRGTDVDGVGRAGKGDRVEVGLGGTGQGRLGSVGGEEPGGGREDARPLPVLGGGHTGQHWHWPSRDPGLQHGLGLAQVTGQDPPTHRGHVPTPEGGGEEQGCEQGLGPLHPVGRLAERGLGPAGRGQGVGHGGGPLEVLAAGDRRPPQRHGTVGNGASVPDGSKTKQFPRCQRAWMVAAITSGLVEVDTTAAGASRTQGMTIDEVFPDRGGPRTIMDASGPANDGTVESSAVDDVAGVEAPPRPSRNVEADRSVATRSGWLGLALPPHRASCPESGPSSSRSSPSRRW